MNKWHWLLAGLIVAVSFFVALYQLGAAPFQDYDEATYAQVTREMMQSKNLFLLSHDGQAYFEKPPLYFWLADMSESVFGQQGAVTKSDEFAMRLPSALSLVALVVVVMLLAYELGESSDAALMAGAIVLTMAPVVDTARQVRMDVLVSFFIVLGAYGFARALKDSRWFYLFGVCVGLAVMTKSVIAVFTFVAAFFIALLWNRWSWLKEKHFWLSMALAALIVLPWHLYETAVYGLTFWREYFTYTVVTRSAQDVFAVTITNKDYIWYLANFAWPWTQLFAACTVGVAVYWRLMRPNIRTAALVSLISALAVIAVFFYAKTKAPTYLLPFYPFAAIFIAICLNSLYKTASKNAKIFLAICTAVLCVLGGASVYYNGFHNTSYYAQTDELAREEKIVGDAMLSGPQPFYAFQTTTLGSIIFYSSDTHPLAFDGSAPAGSLVVLPSTATTSLSELYPQLKTNVLYSGAQITLLKISNS